MSTYTVVLLHLNCDGGQVLLDGSLTDFVRGFPVHESVDEAGSRRRNLAQVSVAALKSRRSKILNFNHIAGHSKVEKLTQFNISAANLKLAHWKKMKNGL